MQEPEFTIVLPTTTDRGPMIPLILGQMQRQSLASWELMVIGDGVYPETRAIIEQLAEKEPRLHFFDHPKHPRRGEPNRHAALAEARGRNVAYCCDRDLWLPDHLQQLSAALEDADWAHTRRLTIRPGRSCILSINCDLQQPSQRAYIGSADCCIALSCVAHTLQAYRRLPFGWRETPKGIKTDHYMWMQFLADPSLRTNSVQWPTVLYFNRGSHPGLSTAERHAELSQWLERLPDGTAMQQFRTEQLARLQSPLARMHHALRSWFWWRPRVERQVRRVANRLPGALDLLGLRR